ncbi:hypothetical protein WN51_02501 [Melipona quadrifasciata]|uniref:Uncharacterized protein n=1 Tax=Melipona quadrifasciata TaxID=166423 RepID=A0A0M8ZSV7_9HYME|nr:hypothetical protein WN51_02501 [Melipona quadrifasciata]
MSQQLDLDFKSQVSKVSLFVATMKLNPVIFIKDIDMRFVEGTYHYVYSVALTKSVLHDLQRGFAGRVLTGIHPMRPSAQCPGRAPLVKPPPPPQAGESCVDKAQSND